MRRASRETLIITIRVNADDKTAIDAGAKAAGKNGLNGPKSLA